MDDMALALSTLSDNDLERACNSTSEMSTFCRASPLLSERRSAIEEVKTKGLTPAPVEVRTISAWSAAFEDIIQYAASLDDSAFRVFTMDQIARAIVLSDPLLSNRLTKMEASMADTSSKRVSLGNTKIIPAPGSPLPAKSISEAFVQGEPMTDIALLATFPPEEVEAARGYEYINMLAGSSQYQELTKRKAATSTPKGILRSLPPPSSSAPSAEMCARCAGMGLGATPALMPVNGRAASSQSPNRAWVDRTSGSASAAPTMGGVTLIAPLAASSSPSPRPSLTSSRL